MLRFTLVWLAAVPRLACSLHATVAARGDPEADWEASVQEAKEVSELSDKIHAAQIDLQKTRSEYARYKRYYSDKEDNLRTQISIRKEQVVVESNSSEYQEDEREFQEKHYKALMCYKLMDAFIFNPDDQQARLHVLEICLGRESLGLVQERQAKRFAGIRAEGSAPPASQTNLHRGGGRRAQGQALRANATEPARWLLRFDREVQELGAKVRALDTAMRRLNATGPRADEMRETLRRVESEEAELQAKMAADKARWKAECDRLAEEERSLGAQHSQQHTDKQAIKEEAIAKAKDDFCPVVQSNYRIDEDEIREHVLENC